MEDFNWVKTPKHILREKALRYLVKKYEPGTFVEFGAGTGDFTRYFLDEGYRGVVLDIDENTIEILKNNLKGYNNIKVFESQDDLEKTNFDYLMAFEVLEHIPDDLSVLRDWSRYLREGGKLIASVPAHQRKYSREDERVGHVRRYEKDQLFNLLKKAGYDNITIVNYGFPLGNISRRVKNIINYFKRDSNGESKSQVESSIDSGIRRDDMENKLGFLFNSKALYPFFYIQKLFFKMDLGDGYVVTAHKKR